VALPTGSKLGPYEIVAPIGAGGMGEVYRARDTRLERTVAVKVLPSHLSASAEVRQRFEREAKTISQLSHPHICALYDVGNQDGVEYLVMEFLEGETLAQRLLNGSLPAEQTLRYGMEIADALDKAHRQGIVHRDLKPGNMMLTKSGVKLLDFGLAKAVAPAAVSGSSHSVLPTQAGSNLTQEGTILGTFQYMAPEQLEGREADARTDIFAFGAVLYEMATGRKAFSGRSQASLISSIMKEEPAPISTLSPMTPPALDRVVKTCLAKDPEDRFQTAHDVRLELQWVAEGGSQAGVPAPVAARRKTREAIAWAGFAAAALAAAALAVGYARRAPKPQQAYRSALLPPEKAAAVLFPALSPDGSHVVFGVRAEGKIALWERALATTEARPLAGTEGGLLPFWSPDGRSIGFFADKKLKRMEIAGGPALTICDADGMGGTWNAAGVILFGIPSGPIQRVAASGGTPSPVTRLDASRHETTHRYPSFLPDGRHFLYYAANLAGAPQDPANLIRAGSLDSRDDRPLVPAYSNTLYASGHLLYVRDGNLLAQRFDPKGLALSDEVAPVAQNVGQFGPFLNFANFSTSDNGVLVYGEATPPSSRLTWFDRDGKKVGIAGESAPYVGVFRLSPDGTKIAETLWDPTTRKSDLWIQELARGARTRLTSDGSNNVGPAWSPDGSRIAFMSDRKHQGALYVKEAAGGGEQPVFEAAGQTTVADWSPDGRQLAIENREPAGERKVALSFLPLEGESKPKPYLQRGAEMGTSRFSPDGRWLAYTSLDSGAWEVYVAPLPGPGGRRQVSTAGGNQPRWRRDGRELFFLAGRKIMAVEIRTEPTFEAGAPKVLFDPGPLGTPAGYEVAADGQRFLVAVSDARETAPPFALVVNWPALRKEQ